MSDEPIAAGIITGTVSVILIAAALFGLLDAWVSAFGILAALAAAAVALKAAMTTKLRGGQADHIRQRHPPAGQTRDRRRTQR